MAWALGLREVFAVMAVMTVRWTCDRCGDSGIVRYETFVRLERAYQDAATVHGVGIVSNFWTADLTHLEAFHVSVSHEPATPTQKSLFSTGVES
jgi:hypothetical protein